MFNFDREFEDYPISEIEKAVCARCGKVRCLVWTVGKTWYDCYKKESICKKCYEEWKNILKERDIKKSQRIFKFNCKQHNYHTDSESEYEIHIHYSHKDLFTRK